MTDDYASLFDYNRWADGLLLEAVRRLTQEQYTEEPAPDCRSVHGTLVHMADTTLIWTRRVIGETVSGRTAEGDVPTLEDAAQFLGRSHEALADLVPMLTPEALAADLEVLQTALGLRSPVAPFGHLDVAHAVRLDPTRHAAG